MAFLDATRFIERLQFFNGQRLFADDLQGLEGFNREMRWLHNQSLHQPGIGSGFVVSGKKGDREVIIQPGYAIDAMGREIVLTENLVIPIPPVSSELDGTSVFFDLTVSYPDDSDLEEAETREGICQPRGVVRLREAPVFCWVRLENLHAKNPKIANDIKNGLKIILARAEVLNCQLNQDLSVAQRQNARPAKQPYIACGAYTPPNWIQPGLIFNTTSSSCAQIVSPPLTAIVPTGSAGFLTTPCYSARIAGPRATPEATPGATPGEIIDGLLNIIEPEPDSFQVEVWLIVQIISGATSNEFNKLLSQWQIVWMGVEG